MSGTESNNSSRPDAPTSATEQTAAQILAAELMSTDEFSQYLLKSKGEMFAVFRGMVEHVSQITMFFNEGRDMVLTDMIAYGDNGIYLDLGASEEMNRKALEADKLFCVTLLEKVKVQFILRSLRRVERNGGPAFLAPLPDSVLRLQRREYYRMATPIARPLKCAISFPTASGERKTIDAHIGDISGGGLGVISIPLDILLEAGLQLGCRIELPEVGTVNGTVMVRSVFEMTTRSGSKSQRAGCEFVKLPGPMLTLIQRYIIKVERERKARESGMT
ncbi:MAG: flagellar brake protein [Candidatus Accumulibacter sp.]|jgi:c-di-GMP-binding flagellar brake protein YcgR|nr:flagellar brake protein [Accumulibacter sp.]